MFQVEVKSYEHYERNLAPTLRPNQHGRLESTIIQSKKSINQVGKYILSVKRVVCFKNK